MRKELVLGIIALSFGILCFNLVQAQYDMTQGSDWKWAYAQSHVDADLLKYNINDNDIAFARMKVAAANKDCDNLGGNNANDQWCKWAREDNATLERMLKAKTNLPALPADNSKSAWQKIADFFKKLFGIT